MDDATLIRGTLAGRLEDFGELVARYQPILHAFVLQEMAVGDDADEVVQKTFLRAYQGLPAFRFETTLKSWLHEIALDECRASGRRRRRGRHAVGARATSTGDAEAGEPPRQAALGREIGRLPRRERVVVTLRTFSDLPFREIARIERISIARAKIRYHRAVNRLEPWLR